MKEEIVAYEEHADFDGSDIVISRQELVRCKDCKWFEMPRFGERGFCKHLDIVTGTVWFCADGERRTGDA